jgi:hypothetical protein
MPDNGRAFVGKTVPCACVIRFRVALMTYFGSLDHKKKRKKNFEKLYFKMSEVAATRMVHISVIYI